MRRRSFVVLLAVAFLAAALEASQPAADRPSTRMAIGAIHLYQATLSRVYGRMGLQCRFVPSCSHYAEASVGALGLWKGGWLAMKRVVRCGPWTPAGTADPPPLARTADARRR